MGEAVVYTTELDSLRDLAEKEETPSLFPRLDSELTPLVMANADVIVRPSWLGGNEVTLGAAMLNYPRRMTEEMADELIAEVHSLLVNRVIKEDEKEPEEKEQSKEDEAVESDEAEDKEDWEEPDQREEAKQKTAEKIVAEKPKTEVIADSKPAQTENPAAEPAEPDQPEVIITADRQTPMSVDQSEVAQAGGTSPKAKTEQVTRTDSQASELMPSNKILKNSVSEPALHLTRHQAVEINKPEVFDLPEKAKIDDGLETLEIEIPEIHSLDSLPEPEITVDEDEAVQDELDMETQEFKTTEESLYDLTDEEEILFEHHEIEFLAEPFTESLTELEVEEALVIKLEDYTYKREETEVREKVAEAGIEIERIQVVLAQVQGLIEVSEPEVAEVSNTILDKISEIAARLERPSQDEAITEAETREELEELFTELFDLLGVEYTPEFIESLAHRTIRLHSADQLKAVESEEDNLPDSGTHEIIKKLLSGTSHSQKTTEKLSAIGKSALQLTIYDFRTELRKRLTA